eukprot:CAMPEP_0172442350 /NCGR_PEP_ID=MMETSP1065-20121228/2808_1 /TAXON_ID=265537 /ORGANISM="Amphiprora paludosa, Strain CCMP125" /LENGTH=607 /DNA_ID=CAMNT_0013192187 /DNA_START=317 /DNA_END=2140 /DNA_ORIENTATION=+
MSIEVHPLPNPLLLGNKGSAGASINNHHSSLSHDDSGEKKEDERTLSVTYAETEVSFGSIHSTLVIRDACEDEGGAGVETSRVTVNTHNSILNITEEDDDDDGVSLLREDEVSEIKDDDDDVSDGHIERSFLFEESVDRSQGDLDYASESEDQVPNRQQAPVDSMSCIPRTPPHCKTTWCESNDAPHSSEVAVKGGGGLFDYVDNLCFRGATPMKDERDVAVVWDQYQRVLEYDIMELLGCANPPDDEELTKVWQNNLVPTTCSDTVACSAENQTAPPQPRARRRQWRERAMRVHRIRTERRQQRATATSFSAPPGDALPMSSRIRSMDDRLWSGKHGKQDSWSTFQLFSDQPDKVDRSLFGNGIAKPIPTPEEDEGYDSDPEERAANMMPSPPLLSSSALKPSLGGDMATLKPRKERNVGVDANLLLRDATIVDTVQESLNMSWSVTWHPGKNDSFKEPRNVNVWIERGTLIEFNTVMLEPNLMWRETFHPELESKRKLNASSQKPHCVRLLNLCRVLSEGIDRSIYPLVRPTHSVLIKTSDGQEYLFEANSQDERDELVRRWKLTTARFATLAVLEDLETICKEFFSPMVTSRMLVPDYDKSAES